MLPAEAAKDVVLAEKPTISGAHDGTEPALLNELLGELGSLASVYHKPASSFVSKMRLAVHRADDLAAAAARGSHSGDSETLTSAVVAESPLAGLGASAALTPTPPVPDLLGDLLDLDVPAPAPAAAAAAAPPDAPNLPMVFGEDKGKGVVLCAALSQQAEGYVYQLSVSNVAVGAPLNGFMIQLNKNALGLAPASQHVALDAVPPGATATARVPMVHNPALAAPEQGQLLQVAIKCNPLGVLYFNDSIPAQLLAPPPPAAAQGAFFF